MLDLLHPPDSNLEHALGMLFNIPYYELFISISIYSACFIQRKAKSISVTKAKSGPGK